MLLMSFFLQVIFHTDGIVSSPDHGSPSGPERCLSPHQPHQGAAREDSGRPVFWKGGGAPAVPRGPRGRGLRIWVSSFQGAPATHCFCVH